MEQFVRAAERAIEAENWYAALAVALTLPDVCGRLESPDVGSRDRYIRWCERYLIERYTRRVGPDRDEIRFLTAGDAYALRCAYVHEGRDAIEEQGARVALARFHFTEPDPVLFVHCNQLNDILQLQVDRFCADICAGVREWLADHGSIEEVRARMDAIIRIHPATDSLRPSPR